MTKIRVGPRKSVSGPQNKARGPWHFYSSWAPKFILLPLGLVPCWSNPPFLIFDIRALWRSVLSARAPECQKLKMVGWTSMTKCKALTGSAERTKRCQIEFQLCECDLIFHLRLARLYRLTEKTGYIIQLCIRIREMGRQSYRPGRDILCPC